VGVTVFHILCYHITLSSFYKAIGEEMNISFFFFRIGNVFLLSLFFFPCIFFVCKREELCCKIVLKSCRNIVRFFVG